MSPVNVGQIGSYIREQREQASISLRQLAQAAGVSNPYLSQIERGLRRPSADILQQIAKGLRISAEALYVQAGLLEDEPSESAVRAVVLADADLTERQKQMLVEIYDSFRKETAAARAAAAGPDAEDPDAEDPDGALDADLPGAPEAGAAADGARFSWPEDVAPAALPGPEHEPPAEPQAAHSFPAQPVRPVA